MNEAIGKLIEAAKGSRDLLAFIAIGLIGACALIAKVGITDDVILVALLAVIWILFRYGLLKVQSIERLRDFRQSARLRATEVLGKHASPAEIEELVKLLTKDDRNGT